ncbi:MAG: FAD:protein FMN transferase [Clostridiaceae bacterium]|nr:FAD:protein FMN transferase [Clostridiaceae bacterium]
MKSQNFKIFIAFILIINFLMLLGCDSKYPEQNVKEVDTAKQTDTILTKQKSSINIVEQQQKSSVHQKKEVQKSSADLKEQALESFVHITEQDNKLIGSAFLLNTFCEITLYDENNENNNDLIYDTFELCRNYENQLSCKITDSEISQLNARQINEVSDSTVNLLYEALKYSKLSDGALDITIGSVTDLWDFTSDSKTVPSPGNMQKALKTVNYQKVQINDNQVSFSNPRTKIDLGAIAKGYIADQMKAYLIEQGVKSAIINLGGNVLCIGTKADNAGFTIAIQKPFEEGYVVAVHLDNFYQSVVTSGIYERFFEKDGNFYHHILNPETGMPVNNNLASVTIISEESTSGDALSTACFVLGLDKGMELIDSLDNVHAIFLDLDGNLYYSENLLEELQIDIL